MVPEELLWLCGTIGSQRFGITLDTSGCWLMIIDQSRILQQTSQKAPVIHVGDERLFLIWRFVRWGNTQD
jgi:hypothetical protein